MKSQTKKVILANRTARFQSSWISHYICQSQVKIKLTYDNFLK